MSSFLQLIQFIGRNAVPLWGVGHGWSPATLLAVYWFENFVGGLLIAARIALHRRLTNKKGHYMVEGQIGRRKVYSEGNFLHHFAVISLLFTAAHGLFLGLVVLVLVSKGKVQLTEGAAEVGGALLTTLVSLLIGFVGDVLNLREQPFAWIRSIRNRAIGRTFVVHMAIIIGMFAVVLTNRTAAFLYVFVVLKLVFDFAAMLSWSRAGDPPPQWLDKAIERQQAGETLEEYESYWIDRWRVDDAAAKEAELIRGAAASGSREST